MQGLWPAFTGQLGAIPAKASVLEWLKVDKLFLQNMLELCIEICYDRNYGDILGSLERIRQEIIQAA